MSEPTTADGAGSPTPKRGSGKDQRKGLFARMALFLRQMVAADVGVTLMPDKSTYVTGVKSNA